MKAQGTSDKAYWHGFTEFYDRVFEDRVFRHIAEIGILKGNSIRWLLDRFPEARICGADILPQQPEWPTDPRVSFTQLDQGKVEGLRQFFSQAPFDLIIEDGSHLPGHQLLGLVEGMAVLAEGGLYILEDIHTSHPAYRKTAAAPVGQKPFNGNALTILLAIDHYLRIGCPVDPGKAALIAANSLAGPETVLSLASQVGRIELYRRARLPDRCYRCGASDYDFSALKCTCGVDIFAEADSMTCAIHKK